MRGVSGGRNLSALKRVSDMDMPPEIPFYIFAWIITGLLACIVAILVPPSNK